MSGAILDGSSDGADSAVRTEDPSGRQADDNGPGLTAVQPERNDTDRNRLRLVLVMGLLALAVTAQDAGRAVPDTKFDLIVSPWRFLSRSLHLWDPIVNSGRLQDQANGYLFPMGPFFGLLHSANMPAWEIQRLWQTTIVLLSFGGVYRVAAAFGVRGFWPRVFAGLVYSLSPRTLSELSSISGELIAPAMMPWMLAPLVRGATTGSARRASARSAIAVVIAGGINAAATVAVLPVPAFWLITRTRGRRRRSLVCWWGLFTTLACLWWFLPLLLLARYSAPFLDWIEPSSATTRVTSLTAVLRGLDHWQAYLGPDIWPAGWILATAGPTVIATSIIAAVGLTGLGWPERRANGSRFKDRHLGFLWLVLITGVAAVTLGHMGPVSGLGASSAQRLLDGALNAFRNVHKFDPMVRFPVAIGAGLLVSRLAHEIDTQRAAKTFAVLRSSRIFALLCILSASAVAVAPILTNRIASTSRMTVLPGWWKNASDWLDKHSDGQRALLLPAANFPAYEWGRTLDTALQPVAHTPFAVRDAVVLGEAGYTRLLDSISAIVASGVPSSELAPLLARSGLGYVVVANDLDTLASGSTMLAKLHSTIDRSPGIEHVADFGPSVGRASASVGNLLDGGATYSRPAVQIYHVTVADAAASPNGMVSLDAENDVVTANGSTDSLPELIRDGLPATSPVIFGPAPHGLSPRAAVLTDGVRRVEQSFGNAHESATMTADQPFVIRRAAHDYLPKPAPALSVVAYRGIAGVSASSSGGDINAWHNAQNGYAPFSAIDGDPATSWRSGAVFGAIGQSLQVNFNAPLTMPAISVTFSGQLAELPTKVLISTEAGRLAVATRPSMLPQTLAVPAGATRWLRITIQEVASHGFGVTTGIAEITLPGLTPERTLVIPPDGSTRAPDALAFTAAVGDVPCLHTFGRAMCDESYGAVGEEDAGLNRTFTVGADAAYTFAAFVRLNAGPGLDALRAEGSPIVASSSSTAPYDPTFGPMSAVDGDPTTSWQEAAGDPVGRLDLRFTKPATLTGLTVGVDPLLAAGAPIEVEIEAGSTHWRGALPESGHVEFEKATVTRSVSIRIVSATLRQSTSTVSLQTKLLPAAINEVSFQGTHNVPHARVRSQIDIGCASGPTLELDGHPIRMAITAPLADVLAGRPVQARACTSEPTSVSAGTHDVDLRSSELWTVLSVTGTNATLGEGSIGASAGDTKPGEVPDSARVTRWTDTSRSISVRTTSPCVLVIHENFNAGWRATVAGVKLEPITVDGWQQAFRLPAGVNGTVELRFRPQSHYVIALLIGVWAVVIVLVAACVGGTSASAAAADDARLGPVLAVGALVLGATVIAGWWGVAIVSACGAFMAALWPLRRPFSFWLGALLVPVAAFVQVSSSAVRRLVVSDDPLNQLLCLSAVVLAAGGVVFNDMRLGRRQDDEP